jgi:UDP-sulfoquinovose synthase
MNVAARPPVAAVAASRSSIPTALLVGGFIGTAAATLAFGGSRRARSATPRRVVESRLRMQSAAALKTKKIFVLGGDGFCGWPTALHLSAKGHEVVIIDNLSRRKIDVELGCTSLTPIASPETRVNVWNELTGNNLRFEYLDIAEQYDKFAQLIEKERPDTIVHFAEQRAAPYSMKNVETKRYTIENNLGATHNVLCAVTESGLDIHLVHLGTMGVYGYGTSGGKIPEGYIDVTLPDGRSQNILHPAYPGSIYHTTKCLDALLFQFYAKNDRLRVTDLHQGIVWGTNTAQTALDERLCNRFDYDGEYGTVLNRFLMQAALGIPLTVYGTGGQTRAFIHISDTCRCIELAVDNPPDAGSRVEILNQVAETARVRDVAQMVAKITGAEVQQIANPRQEDAENELDVKNDKFKLLGLEPITLDSDEGLFKEVSKIAERYTDRCDRSKVISKSYWNKTRAVAATGTQAKGVGEHTSAEVSEASKPAVAALATEATEAP